ncbi:PREDICTED: beta-galactoside alpha-2,6-sialyltransferase 1 [Nicrophorus vespilloides]|uniref:beta-galactoside alpha-(2,6)-sialyltransferase n=1 Tax=Nicrophorus vespilloides TaxID=110193 RepID=A0ABM1MRM5_NICVS|nr:PREDICTED: beta-galactoside alpha-2,6-sialyltransferase 1 [Nicrophorus vespilloides]XP_017777226.1 PREDICTED: beta-galactoside alpha-2,6-sialyltransferase 1 [Nicrophorus vespilloides]
MRALAVTIWVFINLIFFGMCGYMYLLWSQYWMYIEKDLYSNSNNYEQQIYYYNRGFLINDSAQSEVKTRTKHSVKDLQNVTIIKNSRPRFPNLQSEDFVLDTVKYRCSEDESTNECDNKVKQYKEKILNELKRVFLDESNVLKHATDQNPYNVHYQGIKENHLNKYRNQLVCEFKRIQFTVIRRSDEPFKSNYLRDLIPKKKFLDNRQYNSCAVVSSAGSLTNSNLGQFIDSHDLVLRFNHAPTVGFEKDVGSKTTVRILNSQVVSKSEFKFLEDNLYRNITLLAWDPSNYTSTLEDWYSRPEFNVFTNYAAYRRQFPKSKFFLLNPRILWQLWDFLQSNSPSRLRRNPPSSGFLGLAALLPRCEYVNVFEYMPSTRVTKRCHYYDTKDNPACTFGVWHPLAAEKLLTYSLNIANDTTTFDRGFMTLLGFKRTNC